MTNLVTRRLREVRADQDVCGNVPVIVSEPISRLVCTNRGVVAHGIGLNPRVAILRLKTDTSRRLCHLMAPLDRAIAVDVQLVRMIQQGRGVEGENQT